jgi:hypothetical protein
MEIYNITKYENISERIRRLAASPPHNLQPTDQQLSNQPRSNKQIVNTSSYKSTIQTKNNSQIQNKPIIYKQTPF